MKKSGFKNAMLLLTGGTLYLLIELLFRGHTHISMFFVGGTCFLLVGCINEILNWETALISQMFLSMLIITTIEFIAGLILNTWLGLDVWNYSNVPYNLMGQICLLFSNFWFLLSLPAILLDDLLRYIWLKEEKPHYKIF